jgi:hypothetical protein
LGTFLVLPEEAPFLEFREALRLAWQEARASAELNQVSADDFTLFGPFARGDREFLQHEIAGNVILDHLAEALTGSRADVSLTPALLQIRRREERDVLALYSNQLGVILAPLWETARTSTLAHELVHAVLHNSDPARTEKLTRAASYFEESHERFLDRDIAARYPDLNRLGRAEEAIAAMVGSIAAGEIRTVAAERALQNPGLAEIAEPIFTSDVSLLVEMDLLPACMNPKDLNYQDTEVTFTFYDLTSDACVRGRP